MIEFFIKQTGFITCKDFLIRKEIIRHITENNIIITNTEVLVIKNPAFPKRIIKKFTDAMLKPKEITNFSKSEKHFFPKTANNKKYPGRKRTRTMEM